MLDMPLKANLRLGLLALTGLALAACGSDHSSTPAPTPTPVTTRAFVHVLDHTFDSDSLRYTYHLTTFSVDARTGLLATVGTLVAATDVYPPHFSLAADPLGRFVYFSPGSAVICYRVDAGTGALTPSGAAPPLKPATLILAPTVTQLLVGGSEPFDLHHRYETLQVLALDQSGLRTAKTLSREHEYSSGYHALLAADAEREIFYISQSFGEVLVAARLDSSHPEGYREVARLDLSRGEGGPNIEYIDADDSATSCLAANGVLLVLQASQLLSFALNDSPAALVPRGYLANAASGRGPLAYVHGLLATATSAGGWYQSHNTSISLYGVGTGGELRHQASQPEGSFVDFYALGFHPSGRFLYAAGILPNSASEMSLVTYSVMPEGSFPPFASTSLFPVDVKRTVDKIVVTPAEP